MAPSIASSSGRRWLAFIGAVALVFSGWFMTPASAETLSQRIARLEPHLTIARPEGPGPFPVLFMLHGCGGPRPFTRHTAQVAVAAGAAVVQVDSFAHRRIGRNQAFATVCTGLRLRGRERAGDLYAALAWARQQSWADGARFAAIGWSHGGWTIMDALALRSGPEMARATGLSDLPGEPLQGFARALLVYPYANVGSYAGRRPWRLNPQVTAIVAGRDYVVGPTRAALQRQRALGSALEIVVFENATHAFEDEGVKDMRVRYNAAATAREHEMLRVMLTALNAGNAARP